jgi:hypothetical protein
MEQGRSEREQGAAVPRGAFREDGQRLRRAKRFGDAADLAMRIASFRTLDV